MKTTTFFCMSLISLSACVPLHNAQENQSHKIRLAIEAGPNKGGIVENTDMSYISGAGVDAFSGATRIGGHVGAYSKLAIGKNDLQFGINYMFSPQTFYYHDSSLGYEGCRKIYLSQFITPFTYNFNLFSNAQTPGLVSLKIGAVLPLSII